MKNKKPVPLVAETAPHDSLAENRRRPVIEAALIPRAPAGFVVTPHEERQRRLTRPADAMRAELLEALKVVVARKDTYRGELGDLAPEPAQAEALLPRLNALQASLEVTETLLAYLQELTAIAYSDAADFLQAVDEEVRHRARRNAALLSDYARVLLLADARSQAIADGMARSRRDQQGAGNEEPTPNPA